MLCNHENVQYYVSLYPVPLDLKDLSHKCVYLMKLNYSRVHSCCAILRNILVLRCMEINKMNPEFNEDFSTCMFR
jgi:hypothetical protein